MVTTKLCINRVNALMTQFPIFESVYDRSLRKLRKKLRFNIAMGTFVPTNFVTLTFDDRHLYGIERSEKKLISHTAKYTPKIDVSKSISDWLKAIKRHLLPSLQYCWRLEIGTHGTHRIHVHLLTNQDVSQFLATPVKHQSKIIAYAIPSMDKYYQYGWKSGFADNAQITDSPKCVANYLSKYMSKNKKHEDSPEEDHESDKPFDPLAYGKRRFGTSQGLLPVPKSTWKFASSMCYDPATQPPESKDNLPLVQSDLKKSQLVMENNVGVHLTLFKSQIKIFSESLAISEFENYLDSPFQRKHNNWMAKTYWFLSEEIKRKYFADQLAIKLNRLQRRYNKLPKKALEQIPRLISEQNPLTYKDKHNALIRALLKLEKKYVTIKRIMSNFFHCLQFAQTACPSEPLPSYPT